MPTIDLNTCVPGQKLRTSQGWIVTYVGKDHSTNYCPHMIRYANGGDGSRTDDGFVMQNPDKRLPTDHDIVEILPVDSDAPSLIRFHHKYDQPVFANVDDLLNRLEEERNEANKYGNAAAYNAYSVMIVIIRSGANNCPLTV